MALDTSLDIAIAANGASPWVFDTSSDPVSPDVMTRQLSGGGYFTAWATDVNTDGVPDSIAVQRFTSTGVADAGIVYLGLLPIKQLIGSDADLRDLISLDALNGGGYSLAYRVPVPEASNTWAFTGALVGVNGTTLGFVGKPMQFTVSGTFSGLTFALRGAQGGVVTEIPLTVVNNGDGTATITVSAANLSGFDNVERLGLKIGGTTQPTDTISVQARIEENWRFFGDNTTSTTSTNITVSPGQTASVFATTGRIDSFHIAAATAVSGQPTYIVVVTADTEVKQSLNLFAANQSVTISGVTYLLNSNGQIVVNGLAPDVNGNIALPTALHDALAYHDASVVLVVNNLLSGSNFSATGTVIAPTVVTEGLHSRVYDASGALTFDHVIGTSTGAEWVVDRDGAATNPHVITGNLANGGYYVGWLTDADHDGLPEAIAVQKFAADGTTSGGVTKLGDLPLLQLAGSEDDPAHLYDIEVLGSGGFAMSYEVPAPVDGIDQPVLTAGGNGQANLFFVGKPHAFTITLGSGSLANATLALRGLNANGQQIDVTIGSNVTAFTTFNVTAAQLAQFANPERVSLVVTGASAGAAFGIHAALEPNWRYGGTEATASAHLTGTVQQLGATFGAFLGSAAGRAESFHIGTVTAASGSPTYSMSVTTDGEGRANLGLFSVGQSVVHDGFTYQLQGNGTISVTGAFVSDGSGNIAVPSWLLSSLAYQDAGITLVIGNLAQNSSFSGDVTYRQPTVVSEGIHTRVYDASGVLQFDHAIDTTGAHEWVVDGDGQAVNPNVTTGELAGGGYYTSWLSDTDNDGLPDAIGVQRFDSSGALVGGVVKLAGLPLKDLVGTQQDAGLLYSVDALTDGSYTASFNVPTPTANFNGVLGSGFAVIGSVVWNYSNSMPIIGRPETITVVSSTGSLSGLQFQLVGVNAQGGQVTSNLSVTSSSGAASITMSASDLAPFAFADRLSLKVVGTTGSQTIAVTGAAVQELRYFDDQPTATVHVDGAANAIVLPGPGGTVYAAAATTAFGRVESFHVTSVTVAPGRALDYSLVIGGDADLEQALGMGPNQIKVIDGVTYKSQFNGTVTVDVTPDANGNVLVPAALLSLMEYHDVSVTLAVIMIDQGSTFSADVTYRTPTVVDDGLYTRTYDAVGNIVKLNATAGPDHLSGATANDVINGLAGNDTIHGGAGNDTIDGSAGVDVAIYDGGRGTAAVIRNSDHSLAVGTGVDGTDTLHHVEQVQFADGLYSFTFARPGPAVVANFNPAFGWASQNQYPRHVADMNGDGYGDVVGFGISGVLVSYGAANGTFSNAAVVLADFGQNAGWANDNQFHRIVADVNGDGRADIIGFGFAGTLVSLAKPDGTFTGVTTGLADFGVNQGWANQNGFARLVGDVNGDGKADIVGFGFAGALVALGNGNGTFQPVKTGIANFGVNQGWTSDTSFHRELADVNGDGRADLIGFGIAGTYVALGQADGTFAAANLVLNDFGANQGWTSNDSFSRLVADVNGDHIADIVGFGIAGTLMAFGKGDGTFTQAGFDVADFGANQGWTSDNTFHREVADMNHDGLADIVGFGIAGVLVGQNQGDFLI